LVRIIAGTLFALLIGISATPGSSRAESEPDFWDDDYEEKMAAIRARDGVTTSAEGGSPAGRGASSSRPVLIYTMGTPAPKLVVSRPKKTVADTAMLIAAPVSKKSETPAAKPSKPKRSR